MAFLNGELKREVCDMKILQDDESSENIWIGQPAYVRN